MNSLVMLLFAVTLGGLGKFSPFGEGYIHIAPSSTVTRIAVVGVKFGFGLDGHLRRLVAIDTSPFRSSYQGILILPSTDASTTPEEKDIRLLLSFFQRLQGTSFTYDLIHYGHGGEGVENLHNAVIQAAQRDGRAFQAVMLLNSGCQDGNMRSGRPYISPRHTFALIVENPKDTIGYFALQPFWSAYTQGGQAQPLLVKVNGWEKNGTLPRADLANLASVWAHKKNKNKKNKPHKQLNLSRGDWGCIGRCDQTFHELHSEASAR